MIGGQESQGPICSRSSLSRLLGWPLGFSIFSVGIGFCFFMQFNS